MQTGMCKIICGMQTGMHKIFRGKHLEDNELFVSFIYIHNRTYHFTAQQYKNS